MKKLDNLLEESFQELFNKLLDSLGLFKTKYFKDLSESEFSDLLELVHVWYYGTGDTAKKIKPLLKKNFIKKLRVLNPPKKLYRAISFKSAKVRDAALKKINQVGLIGSDKELTSWTTDKKIIKAFIPGGYYASDQKAGILFEIHGKEFKDNIIFSLSHYIKTDKERREFLQLVSKLHVKNLDKMIATVSPKKLADQQLFGKMHGAIFAMVEDEYILSKIHPDKIKNIKITTVEKDK